MKREEIIELVNDKIEDRYGLGDFNFRQMRENETSRFDDEFYCNGWLVTAGVKGTIIDFNYDTGDWNTPPSSCGKVRVEIESLEVFDEEDSFMLLAEIDVRELGYEFDFE